MKRFVLAVLMGAATSPAFAIFTNGGFETGDFTGWTFQIGTNNGLIGAQPFSRTSIVFSGGGANTSQVVGAGADPRAPQLILPRVGAFTARVNDFNGGANINGIRQQDVVTSADVDPADGLLHVRFSYAAVLEDPGHSPSEQPFFYVQLNNVTAGTLLYSDFTFSAQPGKTFFTTGAWKSTNFINVDIVVPNSALGQTLEIEAIGADCSLGGHGGYVYLDGFGSTVLPPGPGQVGNIEVPTLSEWALIAMSMMLAGLAFYNHRRRGGGAR